MELNCHYNQQARLKEFARMEGKHYKLTMVDIKRRKIGSRNVEKAFYQKGLYSEEVERELNSKIEMPGMRVFSKVYNSKGAVILTRDELETMKKYLLVQLYRNPTNMATYSPNWAGDILGFNKEFKNDAEANKHVCDEIHTICNSTWKELSLTKDRELLNNIVLITQTMTLFVKSDVLEFVINDIGSVTERRPYFGHKREDFRNMFKVMGIGEIPDDKIDELIRTHQYYDNFTFYPISSYFGIVLLTPIWTNLIKEKQPFRYVESLIPDYPFDVEVDFDFFDWAERKAGVHSEFIRQHFVPCINIYESEKLQDLRSKTVEEAMKLIVENSSPNDKYFYPVAQLNLNWSEYLNRLTINEARDYFAFGSISDGKISVGNYEMERLMYCKPGEAKLDLSWIDFNSDWTQPLN